MKYLVILADGVSDRPIKSRGNQTPLMLVDTPHLDEIARFGCCGRVKNIPDDMPPGSAVANLEVLGYDSHLYFEGRGVLEAANLGVDLEPSDIALRVNLIHKSDDGKIVSHSSGHIDTSDARVLIDELNHRLGSDDIKFHAGLSYKHLLILKRGSAALECFPPHDYLGSALNDILPKAFKPEGELTAALLRDLIEKSAPILAAHPINEARLAAGRPSANSIWPWSPGKKPSMPLFKDLFGLKGAVISAVDLINGIGCYAGMTVIKVEGATGLHTTNYEGKAQAAIHALKSHDYVYLHIEASDEAGHDGDLDLKIKTVEYLDRRLTKYILDHRHEVGEALTIALLPDHSTPVELRSHTREAVPFTIYNPTWQPDSVQRFDEKAVESGIFGVVDSSQFVKKLLSL